MIELTPLGIEKCPDDKNRWFLKINNYSCFKHFYSINYKYFNFYKCNFKALSNMYKDKQGEYNELMARYNEQLKSNKSPNDPDTAQDLQCPSKTLPIR